MKKSKLIIIVMCCILLVLLVGMSIGAILLDDGGAPYEFTSVRGENVTIYGGEGLYKYDIVDKALMMRAYDIFYLCIGNVIMIVGLVLYIKNRMIGFFLLIASLFFLIYSFIISSIGTAHNEYFLLYMIMFVLSIFTVVSIVKEITYKQITSTIISKLPIKTLSIFAMILAFYFIVTWLIIDFSVLVNGTIHPDVSIYTTAELNVTDLSIYAVFSITGAVLLLQKKALGAILTIGIIVMAFETLTALTIYLFLNAKHHSTTVPMSELPLPIFAVVCLVFSLLALYNLRKCRIQT